MHSEPLMTPGEVAALFRVDPKTVTRWAADGRLDSIKTPGGHRRFRESEVRLLLEFEEDGNGNTTDSADGGHAPASEPGDAVRRDEPGRHPGVGGHVGQRSI